MTRQIAVRLPNDIVEFIDGVVEQGEASSRAVVVPARSTANILARAGSDADPDQLSEHAARTPTHDLG